MELLSFISSSFSSGAHEGDRGKIKNSLGSRSGNSRKIVIFQLNL